MTLQVALTHRTRYDYDRPVYLYPQVVRLRPAPHARTPVLSYSLRVSPEKGRFTNWQQDPFGNWQARLVFPEKVSHFHVDVDLVAEMLAINPFDFFIEEEARTPTFRYEAVLKKDLAPYLETFEPGPLLAKLIAETRPTESDDTLNWVVALNQKLRTLVDYLIRMEPGVQTPEETLKKASGSCRDSAWLLCHLLRHHGFAARFVSGYLIQLTADLSPIDGGAAGPTADFTDLHAWAEVFLPGAGWVGLDATSGLLTAEGHIPLAATPEPASAAAISGGVENCEVEFHFEMKVERILETPRVSAPYTVAQWSAMDAAGKAIDRRLEAGDVRLTVGGEPTFLAAYDRDGDEWNTAAVGPTKRGFADRLIRRLRERFAPGGLLHYGQGKWYPGEQLPRWAFSLYWRTDAQPLWLNPELVAPEADKGATVEGAERFAVRLAEQLGVGGDYVQAAYEDAAAFLRQEAGLPINVTTEDNRLEDPQERARLARVFGEGLGKPKAFILPIQAAQAQPATRGRRFQWLSEIWAVRLKRLVLAPGDSPAGFRLPLNTLPWIDEELYPLILPTDAFSAEAQRPLFARPERTLVLQGQGAPAGALATPAVEGSQTEDYEAFWTRLKTMAERRRGRERTGAGLGPVAPGEPFLGGGLSVRTALTVEPRGGVLCVFLPPVRDAEEYVDLISAVEDVAAELGQPVHVEGYPPPRDARLREIKVTPDPGVIEVNIQPSASWEEQVHITETVYEEARQLGLDSSTFELDGRPAGTGGGNHVVMGGASPPDSPFLRRPDMLASIIRYWQRHPSLSYLFSGLFIGPTSQAPRIDEARDDQLFEMEIALQQVPDPASGVGCPPWLVDRIFRHLLVDSTGNTHRAEICIDKLYSPDGPTGRLGLVEFRAFEMPPHPRMSLAQQLVLRALIAWFWERPFTQPLTPHRGRLRDFYMLPHGVWSDFEEVLADLAAAGFPLEPAWFVPHFEFRFPVAGSFSQAGVEVELRTALEPWHVLGEEAAVGGTARYVDSSLERLQVRVNGDLGDRYAVACNGWTLPLTEATGPHDRVAGVRFRAWLPPSCLHPTIGVHSPLTIEVYDLAQGRALGGATHHVMHPGGRAYETRPINALEAQGRRLGRFQAMGHTPGRAAPRTPRMVADADGRPGCTLDLRLQR
ncbi:DUF2126 domain-containing protein [Rubrimonas cliftonensis]|uniref:Uncharacterized conserved protein, DUF2126 family n=1 Tax=Rubrimonas cliftonensis TaxID=89524 RepID=A0A1H3VJC1_9RHOB|nr:transglutaminase family protein [Rubrimonas cliftonensis]SDZ74866.1 Uncharacterized conserved protein, DUF2126 family [Rubrimonas cliftonensis]